MKVCAVTTSRADYGLLYYLLLRLKGHPRFDLKLVAGGMHLKEEYGHTINEIITDGFDISGSVDMLGPSTDSPLEVSRAIGRGVALFAEEYDRLKPDLVMVFGDRFEMFSAACAAVSFNIPLAHIGGGESTAGSVDDVYRYAITSMSRYHFVSMPQYREELIKRGVKSSRIKVVGYPAVENIKNQIYLNASEIEKALGITVDEKYILATVHPETSGNIDNLKKLEELLRALESIDNMVIFTASNADAGGGEINQRLQEFCRQRENAFFYKSLGRKLYLSLLKGAAAVIGNSSSGIVETAFWGVPALNLGRRQEGRIRGKNVIDVEFNSFEIKKAMLGILEGSVIKLNDSDRLIFGRGDTSDRIIESLEKFFFGND